MPPIPIDAVESMMLDELKAQPGELVSRIEDVISGMLTDRDTVADRLAEAERALVVTEERTERVKRDHLDGRYPPPTTPNSPSAW